MTRSTPLLGLHEKGEGLLVPYGVGTEGAPPVMLVAAFDPVQIEYASIRRAAAVFDQPGRATLVATGPDRLEFLNRMLTQEVGKGRPGQTTPLETYAARSSFWLNRKGRIDSDLRVLNLPECVLLDCDVHAAARTLAGLSGFIISEDVQIQDQTERWHRLSLHGPSSLALLSRVSTPVAGAPLEELAPGTDRVSVIRIDGVETIVDRRDLAGEIGLELLIPVDGAVRVYEAISTPWSARDGLPATPQTELARRIGWHALNIARIEAGTPIYYLDFGPDSLPHETGLVHDRVNFKKGCYLGQEVVARMDALGHPKQRLVGLDIDPPKDAAQPALQPETGAALLAGGADGGADAAQVVGAVTSSCISPMLGSRTIALAMVKWSHSTPGTLLHLVLPGQGGQVRVEARVRATLAALIR